MDETRTIPESIESNEEFTLIKVNPDRIRFAFYPVVYGDRVVYQSDTYLMVYNLNSGETNKLKLNPKGLHYLWEDYILYVEESEKPLTGDIVLYNLQTKEKKILGYGEARKLDEGRAYWYDWSEEMRRPAQMSVYDIDSGLTERYDLDKPDPFSSNDQVFRDLSPGSSSLNVFYYDHDADEIIDLTQDNREHTFSIGSQYLVWSDYYVGEPDKIHVMRLSDRSVKEISPSQDFIEINGYPSQMYEGAYSFSVSQLGAYKNKILVKTSKCIYTFDAETLEETKIVCDNHLIAEMQMHENKIVFRGNDRNVGTRTSGESLQVNNDAFLILI